MPKDQGILNQLSYVPYLRESASAIKEGGAELVLILGNDDNQHVIPEMEKGDKEGLWHYVADRVKEVRGYEFCGCPWIRDYPFGYKYWVAAESEEDLFMEPFQLGPPVIINQDNAIEEMLDSKAYLLGKPSIAASLESMAMRVKDISKSIWLVHQPPVNLDFDLCGSGARVGSPAVYNFLSAKQPLLSIHGHIHEAPEVNGNIWAKKLGQTMCIQAGQPEKGISYALFELKDAKITDLSHAVYGSYRHSI